jgi:hypothetical protein
VVIARGLLRFCERDNAAPLGANSLDQAPKMSQHFFDARGVSVTNLVQRLNERIGIVSQLRHNGVGLVDKLDERSARIDAGAPDRGAGELSDPLDALRVAGRGEVCRFWRGLGLGDPHSPREFLHVHDLASFSASILHPTLPLLRQISGDANRVPRCADRTSSASNENERRLPRNRVRRQSVFKESSIGKLLARTKCLRQ